MLDVNGLQHMDGWPSGGAGTQSSTGGQNRWELIREMIHV